MAVTKAQRFLTNYKTVENSSKTGSKKHIVRIAQKCVDII